MHRHDITVLSLCVLFVWHRSAVTWLCFQHRSPFLAQEEVSFCLSLIRRHYPRISEECWGIIIGEWKLNISNKGKWAKRCPAWACPAEETPQSSDPGWAGQLWLWGKDARHGDGALTLSPTQCLELFAHLFMFQSVKVRLKLMWPAGRIVTVTTTDQCGRYA